MTAYNNFTSDFPARCMDVLDLASGVARVNGREVTLLLMAASASLLVPYERLKPDTNYSSHPFGNNKRFLDAANELKDLMAEKFVGSVLCSNQKASWKLAQMVQSVEGDLDSWLPQAKLKTLSSERLVKSTLTLVRNALAHGNIYTTGDPIKDLIFVMEVTAEQPDKSRRKVGFDVLSVSHVDFLNFVRAWVKFLDGSKVWELRLVA